MAYQNIAGVEPHPSIPGASIVRFRDGSFMPAPSGVAAKFDPNRQALAQNAPLMSEPGPMASTMPEQLRNAQAPSVSDVGPLYSAAPPPPPPPQFSMMSEPGPNISTTPAYTAPPSPPKQPTLTPTARGQSYDQNSSPYQGELVDRVSGLMPYQLARRTVVTPGRAAFDPERYDASLRPVRQSQTEQRSGRQAWDEEAQLNNVINQRQAIQAKAEADNLAAQSNLEAQRMYAQDLQSEAQAAAAAQRAEEERWRSEQMRLSDEAKSVAGETVNPNRVFSAAGPFQMIGLAVAAALKGYATKGTDTSVIDNVQRIVDRDVAIQEQQISRKKGEIDNALYRNAQRYGSIEAGRSATKAQQLQAALARFDANKARIGINAQTAQIEAQRQALEAAVYSEYEQAKMLSQGTTTTAVASAMQAPRAAIAPGKHKETDKEWYDRIAKDQAIAGRGADIVGKQLISEGKDLENAYVRARGMTPEQAAKAEESIKNRVEHLGKSQSELSSMRTQVDQIVSLAGITEDKEGNAKHKGIPGVGVGYNVAAANPIFSYILGGRETAQAVMADLVDAKGGRIRRAAMELLTAKIKEASGSAFSEKEAERHATSLAQGLSQGEDAFAQAMVDFRRTLANKELELKAAAGTDAVAKYKADKAAIAKEEKSTASGVRGSL